MSLYVDLIADGKFAEALAIIREEIPFPRTVGRVCYAPCEDACRQMQEGEPVAIRRLKRFVADQEVISEEPVAIKTGKRVAIVGSGPAGLTAAYYLARLGHGITVFEALPEPGGMMRVGIPDYRLPKEVLQRDIDEILKQGVEIKVNTPIGPDLTLDDLRQQGYDSIFISTGAHKSRPLKVDGVDLGNVFQGVYFLRDMASGQLAPDLFEGERIVILGGGNVAMDCARTSVRLGAKEVQLACLESREEMPAHEREIQQAVDEGVILNCSWGPKRILGNGNKDVTGIEFIRCTSVFDSEGRFTPSFDETVEISFEVEAVIIAIGQASDLSFLQEGSKVQTTDGGTIKVNDITLETDVDGIFAGGDVVSGPASVIEAIASGKRAAISIDKYLGGSGLIKVGIVEAEELVPQVRRVPLPSLPLAERLSGFTEVEPGLTEEMAIKEAKRCRCKGGGIKVMEMIQEMPRGKLYITYLAFPTEFCTLCAPRIGIGLQPACVAHCMAGVMKFGAIEKLSEEMLKKPRTVVWAVR